jgi:hypothetical protein
MVLSKRSKHALAAGAALAAVALGAAIAETAASPLPAAVQRLLDCRGAPDATRLACYDGAVAEFGKLVSSGEIVVVDHERVAKVKRQAFGFSLPSLSLFEHTDKPQELEQVTGVVTHASLGGDNKWILTLDDGSVWQQTDAGNLAKYPKKGSKVEIRRAAMGSFFMNVDGQRALRVKRVQ